MTSKLKEKEDKLVAVRLTLAEKREQLQQLQLEKLELFDRELQKILYASRPLSENHKKVLEELDLKYGKLQDNSD